MVESVPRDADGNSKMFTIQSQAPFDVSLAGAGLMTATVAATLWRVDKDWDPKRDGGDHDEEAHAVAAIGSDNNDIDTKKFMTGTVMLSVKDGSSDLLGTFIFNTLTRKITATMGLTVKMDWGVLTLAGTFSNDCDGELEGAADSTQFEDGEHVDTFSGELTLTAFPGATIYITG
mmetsp:Transcript_19144/g.47777  ORF Transcript_19144/g.47777 Transcript_19144/m.47777 type:complete len:175 (+) Transcript_19144:658-1182(+)